MISGYDSAKEGPSPKGNLVSSCFARASLLCSLQQRAATIISEQRTGHITTTSTHSSPVNDFYY